MKKEILLVDIITDCGVQSRKLINDTYVAELSEIIKAGTALPLIDVFHDGSTYWLADGFHRVMAYNRLGNANVTANVIKGTLTDAKIHSLGANKEHGLRRTNEDKRFAVEMALGFLAERSDRYIADLIGVSDSLVLGVRRLLFKSNTTPEPVKRVGTDGRSYNPSKPRLPTPEVLAEIKAKTAPPPVVAPKQDDEVPPQVTHISEKQDESERLDENLKPIPDHLWPLWDRGEVIKSMAADVTRIANEVRKMHDSGDLSLLECNGQEIVAALETAKANLKSDIPYAVCPYCIGKLSKDCRFCSGRGIVGHFRFKMVPKELVQ
jgi:hypothetical protein